MSRTWSDSAWRERLSERLEPLLKSKELVSEISTYQGVPFALFAYPPTVERELRREVKMLATRVEHETGRKVTTISMADLLWEAIRKVHPPDGTALFEAERSMADESPQQRLESLQEEIRAIVSEHCPLPKLIAERAAGLDPATSLVFLVRVGALYPAYRASSLLENLMGEVKVPTVLFYPGTRARTGTNMLRFMDSLEALHGYRHKIF
jgi:hypothetical protein